MYMEDVLDEYEEEEEQESGDSDKDYNTFQAPDMNGESVRRITLPQPNGQLSVPLMVEVDKVR